MSFWLFGNKKNGRRNLYSVSVSLNAILLLVLALVLVCLPLINGSFR